MRLSLSLALLLCLRAFHPDAARAGDSSAPDVVLYCTPALQAPLHQAAEQYRAANHVEIHILVSSPDGQAGLIRHRARADVIIGEASLIGTLAAEHLLRSGSVVPLGADPFVLIIRKGVTLPHGATPAQLLAAHTMVLTDATTAASFDGSAILHAAVPDAKPTRSIGVADTPTVIALIAHDPSLLGLVNRTEATGADIAEAAALAAPPAPISGALCKNGQSRNAASLLAFIAGPQGRAILQSAGLETAS